MNTGDVFFVEILRPWFNIGVCQETNKQVWVQQEKKNCGIAVTNTYIKSMNMTAVDYFRGQNAYAYKIEEPFGPVAASMNAMTAQLVYQNGKDASNLAKFDQDSLMVAIQTNNRDLVGL